MKYYVLFGALSPVYPFYSVDIVLCFWNVYC